MLFIRVGEGGAGGAVAPPLLMDRFFSTAVIVIECLFSNLLRKHQNASQTILFPLLYYLLPLCSYRLVYLLCRQNISYYAFNTVNKGCVIEITVVVACIQRRADVSEYSGHHKH